MFCSDRTPSWACVNEAGAGGEYVFMNLGVAPLPREPCRNLPLPLRPSLSLPPCRGSCEEV